MRHPDIYVFGILHKSCYNEIMIMKAFKYRLYPTKAQRAAMCKSLDACRWVYNKTLEVRRDAWEDRQEYLSLYATHKMLPEWKRENPTLVDAYSQSLQDAQLRVDLALKDFFRRVKAGVKPGYPRFRGRERYDSFTYPQSGFSFAGKGLRLSRIGSVKIKLHRPLEGKIKTLNIRRDSLGNWYACFVCECDPEPMPPTHKTIGIDMGLETFATLSTGEKTPNPRFFRRDEKALARVQRKLSEAGKGTPERAKRRRAVQHVYERISNRRRDFAHQLSRKLVNEYQLVSFEDLNVTGMAKNHRIAKSISDASWNQLIRYATYKAECAGRRVVTVDPRNTSRMCSQCGTIVDKDLTIRVHSCPCCGLEIDRDHNAALNILALGLQRIGTQSVEAP